MAASNSGSVQANPVVRNCVQCLIHAPDLVRYGSKPRREILKNIEVDARLAAALRDFDAAVRYPPNQTYIGNLNPGQLAGLPRPWHAGAGEGSPEGPFGGIVSQETFYALLERANVLTPSLVELTADFHERAAAALVRHPVLTDFARLDVGAANANPDDAAEEATLPLNVGDEICGLVRRDDRAEGQEDVNLDAGTLLEGLCTKASGAVALRWLLHREGIGADEIEYVISCGEEAAGDRYQRGAGGMAKSIAEMCGCVNASGMDVKNFCAGPASALVTAGALVKAGLYRNVAVVAGGSLAKLGMKFEACLEAGIPVLEDCLGATAFLVTPDDGESPVLRLERGAVGLAKIGASTSDRLVYEELIHAPLSALGLKLTDVDKFAPELHNPEIMAYAGSGDVTHKNYRIIAALAVMAGEIGKADMETFAARVGMVGFAPTQGHIPSAVPYMPHAIEAMARGEIRRVMFICKASLFLNRLTELYDGVSFMLEANPGREETGSEGERLKC